MAARDDRLISITPDQEPWGFDAQELQNEWVGRINGSEGCWRTDKAINF